MATDPKFGSTFAEEGVAGGYAIFNRLIQRLTAVVQCNPASRGDTAPPGSPADGDHYILGAAPSGDWSSFAEHDIAFYYADQSLNNGWIAITPEEGWFAFVKDANEWFYFDGTLWADVASIIPTADVQIGPKKLLLDAAGTTSIDGSSGGDVAFSMSGQNTCSITDTLGLRLITRASSSASPPQIQIHDTPDALAPLTGTASYTTFSGVKLAQSATAFSVLLPSGYTNTSPGWIKCFDGTSEIAIPYATKA